jgi:hypothetical protein
MALNKNQYLAGGKSMNAKASLQERTELFENVFQFKRNKRVPLASNFWTWTVLDAGYKLSEAIYDYSVMGKIQDEFHRRYQFDAYADLGTRNPMRVTDALGAGFHKIDPTDETIVVDDHHLMERDEYQVLAKNPVDFYYSRAFKRYCKGFPKIKYYNLLVVLAYNSNPYGIYFPVALSLASVRQKYEPLCHICSCLIGI